MVVRALRYTITTGGGPKKILSAWLRPQGDLIIDLKPAEGARPDANRPIIKGDIELDRSSVHASTKSAEGNLITRTTPRSNGALARAVQFTRAIKSTNRFAPIIHRRFPDISYAWPESNCETDISLGSFDSDKNTLILSVFVGNSLRPFVAARQTKDQPYLRQDIIGPYRIVLVYDFLPLPSIPHGTSHFENTIRPGECPSPEREVINEMVMNGYLEVDVINIFRRKKDEFTENYYKLSISETQY